MITVKLRLGERRPTIGITGDVSLGADRPLRQMGASRCAKNPMLNAPFNERSHYSIPMPLARRLFNRSKEPHKWRQPSFMLKWQQALGRQTNGLMVDKDAYEYYQRWLRAEADIASVKKGDVGVIHTILARNGVSSDFFAREPKPHQEAGLAFFLIAYEVDAGHILLLDEMRTGKTKQMIDIARWLLMNKIISSVLVICPNTIKRVWQDELRKDAPLHSWLSGVVQGTKAKRRELWNSPAYFWIVNFESARNDYKEIYEWQDNRPNGWLLLVDEFHKLKSPNALVTKTMLGHQAMTGQSYEGLDPDFSVFATGTPVANTPVDIFTVADFTCPGILNQNIHWFNIQFASKGGRSGKEITGYKNLDEIRWRLARTSMRRQRKDVVFDETIISPRVGQMQKDQAEAYKTMRDTLYAEIIGLDGEPTAVEARNHLSKMIRLCQITSGYLSPDPETFAWFEGYGWKIAEIDSFLDDYLENLGKIVIWSRFVQPLYLMQDRYSKHLPLLCKGQMGDKAVENMYKFQREPQYKIMLAQYQSAEGKGFQPATTAVMLDKWLSPHLNQQAADRIVGIENPVTVCLIPLITENTIDERIEFLLKEKRDWSDAVTGDIRETEIHLPVLDKGLLLYLLSNPSEAKAFEEAYTDEGDG